MPSVWIVEVTGPERSPALAMAQLLSGEESRLAAWQLVVRQADQANNCQTTPAVQRWLFCEA